MLNSILHNYADRRSGIESRQFSYYEHIPERRSGKERRIGKDKRRKLGSRAIKDYLKLEKLPNNWIRYCQLKL